MKRLPVFLLVAALILALVAGAATLPLFVSAQGETPTPPALPTQRPTISAALPDGTTVDGVLEESCWPQTSPDQQLCEFASDSTPTQTITLGSGEALILSVVPAEPPPSELTALVFLDPPPANGEAALTLDLTNAQGTLNASALPSGSSNFLVAVIASYAAADGGEYYVRSNFKVTSDAGTSGIATSEATSAATLEPTVVVSAPTAETPVVSATETATVPVETVIVVTPAAADASATTFPATVVAPTTEVVATETSGASTAVATSAVPTATLSAAEESTALVQTRNASIPQAGTTVGTTAAGATQTVTASPTITPSDTLTLTPTSTNTATFTPTPTFTATFTPTFTFTPTPTNTPTFTYTPTSTFTPTPTPTNTPLAPDLIVRVGGRDFAPIRLTVSFTGNEGDAVTVSRANRAGSFRVLASPADAAQIIFTGPRPSAVNVTLLSSDGLSVLNTQTLSPDNLVLYTLPSEPGAYVVAIEVQFTQLGSVKALYYFRLVIGT